MQVRGDQYEGTTIFRPKDCLLVHYETQGRTFILPHHKFKSAANQKEIFVFCMSRSFTDDLRKEFKAVACVEVLNVGAFCKRIQEAISNAKFPAKAGRARIGNRIEYYSETEGCNPRWALPDIIAISKLDSYSWQDEYRLVFSLTDASGFQKVNLRLATDDASETRKPTGHSEHLVQARSLRDICKLHVF